MEAPIIAITEADEELAKDYTDRRPVVWRQYSEGPLLLHESAVERLINEVVSLVGQSYGYATSINRVGRPLHQARPLQTIQPVRHAARRQLQAPGQPRWPRLIGCTTSPECGEDIKVSLVAQPILGGDFVEPRLKELSGSQNSVCHLHR